MNYFYGKIENFIENPQNIAVYFPSINIQGVIEIIILTYLIYNILVWIRNSKAYPLLKGIGLIALFYMVVNFFGFTVLTYLMEKAVYFLAIAPIIIFQNEIRAGLDHIGRTKWIADILPDVKKYSKKVSEKTIQEIVKASFRMASVKTGALMVIEGNESLEDIEKSGIMIEGKVSSGLLINIFEKNTPLHDGAVLIEGDIVKAATCYLPLSDNQSISKSYGTRHRAALGMSEESDSLIIVVSEETGNVSICKDGKIDLVKDEKELNNILISYMYKDKNNNASLSKKIKGFFKYEKSTK